jgi:Transposase DDE domain
LHTLTMHPSIRAEVSANPTARRHARPQTGAPHAPEDDPAALRAALGMLERTERSTKLRWRIECAFNRLKDFRRIATRYDRLARNYLASVCLAAALVWWI